MPGVLVFKGKVFGNQSLTKNNGNTNYRLRGHTAGPNFMALLTVSTESALTDAGNSVLTASVFHGLAANLGFCVRAYFTLLGILRLQG